MTAGSALGMRQKRNGKRHTVDVVQIRLLTPDWDFIYAIVVFR